MPTGSSLEQKLVIAPISLKVASFRGIMKLRQRPPGVSGCLTGSEGVKEWRSEGVKEWRSEGVRE